MTKDELDARLSKVVVPGPIIEVGPYHPIESYEGYGEPWPGWYRGARVIVVPNHGDRARVVENGHHEEVF